MKEKYHLLYDGDCGFCNFWVQWILQRDKKDLFRFASLQSEFGQSFLTKRQLNTIDFDTVYLVAPDGTYYDKFSAIIKVGQLLGGIYQFLSIFKIFPKFLKDKIYHLVAENRKKIAGEHCLLPTPEERKKFIL